MGVTIIADDLTGACDTGALFAGQGLVGVFVAPDWMRWHWTSRLALSPPPRQRRQCGA